MNIAIEARALSTKSGGIKSYTQNIIRELTSFSDTHLDIMDGSARSSLPLRSELLLSYWMNGPVAHHVQDTKPDVVHFTKAAIPRKKYTPTVVTIYDVIPLLLPETQSFLRRMYWPTTLQHAATHADRVLTISETSKQDISRMLHISEEKITVTTLAVDTTHFIPQGEKNTDPYILFVGTWDNRKNIQTLLRSFELVADRIPHRLVIAGKPAHKQDTSRSYAHASLYGNRIEFREHVPYAELPALYSNADVFVWPSIYEGWGFPPQEAMACGTPVIVSNGGSLPEVVGDAGIVVPFSTDILEDRLHDEEFTRNLSQQILNLVTDEQKRKDFITRGLIQAKKVSWHDVAEKTHAVYKALAI